MGTNCQRSNLDRGKSMSREFGWGRLGIVSMRSLTKIDLFQKSNE